MKNVLCKLIAKAKTGDKDSMNKIIEKFSTQLSKYSHELDGDDTLQNLKLFLIILIKKMSIVIFANKPNKILEAYISRSLKHEKYRLIKIIACHREHNCHLVEQYDICEDDIKLSDSNLYNSLQFLSKLEREIIYYHYFCGYTLKNTALMLGIKYFIVYQIHKKP